MGGLCLTDTVTNAIFYDMIEIVCLIHSPYNLEERREAMLQEETENNNDQLNSLYRLERREEKEILVRRIEKNDDLLLPGNYHIVTTNSGVYLNSIRA